MVVYLTNSEADEYFESRYNSNAWDETSESEKTKALATATRYIDNLNFIGDKTDEDQSLEFPREGDTEIPDVIKWACCEVAFALIEGADVEFDAASQGIQSATMSIARISSDPNDINIAKLHNIPSSVAWAFLKPYLRDPASITINRVD